MKCNIKTCYWYSEDYRNKCKQYTVAFTDEESCKLYEYIQGLKRKIKDLKGEIKEKS